MRGLGSASLSLASGLRALRGRGSPRTATCLLRASSRCQVETGFRPLCPVPLTEPSEGSGKDRGHFLKGEGQAGVDSASSKAEEVEEKVFGGGQGICVPSSTWPVTETGHLRSLFLPGRSLDQLPEVSVHYYEHHQVKGLAVPHLPTASWCLSGAVSSGPNQPGLWPAWTSEKHGCWSLWHFCLLGTRWATTASGPQMCRGEGSDTHRVPASSPTEKGEEAESWGCGDALL